MIKAYKRLPLRVEVLLTLPKMAFLGGRRRNIASGLAANPHKSSSILFPSKCNDGDNSRGAQTAVTNPNQQTVREDWGNNRQQNGKMEPANWLVGQKEGRRRTDEGTSPEWRRERARQSNSFAADTSLFSSDSPGNWPLSCSKIDFFGRGAFGIDPSQFP